MGVYAAMSIEGVVAGGLGRKSQDCHLLSSCHLPVFSSSRQRPFFSCHRPLSRHRPPQPSAQPPSSPHHEYHAISLSHTFSLGSKTPKFPLVTHPLSFLRIPELLLYVPAPAAGRGSATEKGTPRPPAARLFGWCIGCGEGRRRDGD